MKRDRGLLIAMLLFAGSLFAGALQAAVTAAYVNAAVMGHWDWFAETFSVEVPGSGPNEVCFDYCAPELPFVAGWIGLTAFLLGWITLAYAWWKSRA